LADGLHVEYGVTGGLDAQDATGHTVESRDRKQDARQGGGCRYILGGTRRCWLSCEGAQSLNHRALLKGPHTRKMLQTIEKTLHSTALKFACGLTLALLAGGTAYVPTAQAQTPATPPTQTTQPAQNSTTSQSQGQAPQTSNGTQGTAAPGTAPLPKATAAALAPYTGPKYDNRWEVYGGLLFMNGQAGQNLPKRYNLGGIDVMGTYWLGGPKDSYWRRHLGLAADYRFGAGTTPLISPYYNRVVAMQSIFAGGVQYRGPKNRYVAIDLNALAGGDQGIFDYATNHYPGGSPVSSCPGNQQPGQRDNLGLYCNHVAPWAMAGGSMEFNESARLAIRIQPDLIFEHFGTETREFVSVSAGVVYRLGKKP
jgi:hypothetical protein